MLGVLFMVNPLSAFTIRVFKVVEILCAMLQKIG